MASEKILAMVEEVKGLSVLELNDFVKALEEEFAYPAAAMAVAAPQQRRAALKKDRIRRILTSSDLKWLYQCCKDICVSVLKNLRTFEGCSLKQSRKLFPRQKLKNSRQSSKKPAQKSNSSNYIMRVEKERFTPFLFCC